MAMRVGVAAGAGMQRLPLHASSSWAPGARGGATQAGFCRCEGMRLLVCMPPPRFFVRRLRDVAPALALVLSARVLRLSAMV